MPEGVYEKALANLEGRDPDGNPDGPATNAPIEVMPALDAIQDLPAYSGGWGMRLNKIWSSTEVETAVKTFKG
jgi:hypothetical protein